MDVDSTDLAASLRSRIAGEVRFDRGSRALYATDASNYRQVPIGVVIPRSIEDVIATVEECRRFDVPVLSRGGGTSLAGQCCNVAVVIDFSKYLHDILEIDPDRRRARVQPGTILDHLRRKAEKYGLTFGPDPSTHNHCTLGGMIGNNSCGVHSVMAGRTSENVEELEILTYDGHRMRVGATPEDELERIIRGGGKQGRVYAALKELRDRYAPLIREKFPNIPRRVSGYNLPDLLPENGFHVARALVGSEGTCVTILEATVRLVHSPASRTVVVLGYPDIYTAGDHITDILACDPIGLEAIDDVLVEDMTRKGLHPRDLTLLPPGRGWLIAEFGGDTREDSDDKARWMMDALQRASNPPSMKLFDDPAETSLVWQIRESGLGATARVPGDRDTWEGWEDSAVPPQRVGAYLQDLRKLFRKFGYNGALYGHFGQGCVHTRIDFDLVTAEGIRTFRAFLDEAADLVLSYGGSLSGEHGDGQSRAELLPKMFGEDLIQAFREFKAIWDPTNRMNPHKIVDPYRITENLRLGTSYRPAQPETWFRYPGDDGSFARATLRCVGVGECRRHETGTMCPSYRATLEEKHSTRGRARLLFEMLRGDSLEGGWKNDSVREALDLCLACKGCRTDCPVNVDMATYKAEFLSHYFEGRRRPTAAYSMGLIPWWARMASTVPAAANFVTHAPGLRTLAKSIAGIAGQRDVPKFARHSFRHDWRRKRRQRTRRQGSAGRRVILWPDTFNNYFHPWIASAAVDVLQAAGFEVSVPGQWLCCGRPLYDFGMLRLARKQLRTILDALQDDIELGTPVVGLEPSCVAVFRDELVGLFPEDENAVRLSRQTFLLSEFLVNYAPHFRPPPLQRRAIVHAHCHHKAVMGLHDDRILLDRTGLDYTLLDSGCCGMAGSFGFERDKYDISMNIGELVLLPAVRESAPDTLIITDGFSCREQIRQATSRAPLHIAEVLQAALRQEHAPAARS